MTKPNLGVCILDRVLLNIELWSKYDLLKNVLNILNCTLRNINNGNLHTIPDKNS